LLKSLIFFILRFEDIVLAVTEEVLFPFSLQNDAVCFFPDFGNASPKSPKYFLQLPDYQYAIIKIKDFNCQFPKSGNKELWARDGYSR
jgi:hypothetical protein